MKPKRKNPHAVALGAKGGKKRAENNTKEQLSEIALKGWIVRRSDDIKGAKKKLATEKC